MDSFSKWLMSENDCSIVALSTISGIDYRKMSLMLRKIGFDPNKGMQPAPISIAAEKLGYTWSVKGTREATGKTANQITNENWPGTWLIFTKNHVMPLTGGKVTNLCGYGEEPISFVMELKKNAK